MPTEQPLAIKRLDYLTNSELELMVAKYAPPGQYEQMLATVKCEAPKWKEDGEMRYFYKLQSFIQVTGGVNGKENSWGLSQWFLDAGNLKEDGTPITKEDAQNPDIALYEMGRYFSMNKQNRWTCWRNAYSSG